MIDVMDRWRASLQGARRLMRDNAKLDASVGPTRRRFSASNGVALALASLAAAGGAAAMFLLDPVLGRGRRAMLANRSRGLWRDANDRFDRGRRHAASRVEGSLRSLAHMGSGDAPPTDAALSSRIESELFRDPAVDKGRINVNVEDGRVVLRGEVDDPGQRDALEQQAQRIPGVTAVVNLLHMPGEPVLAATRGRRRTPTRGS
jgi:BON domain